MDLRELKTIWNANGFRPNKRLGQNFLIDKNVRNNILRSLNLRKSEVVVEIGPGFGVMTFDLAEMGLNLVAIEKDRRVCEIMAPYFDRIDNIELVNSDILDVDIASLPGVSKGKAVVYGNVPYYISTPIIEKMIEQKETVDRLYVVIQEEVADRLVAKAGSKTYGSVSCYVQYHTRPRKVMRIKKNCFYPVPKVDSSLVELEMLSEPSVTPDDPGLMFRIIRKAFSQRRKKMINPLSDGTIGGLDKNGWQGILDECKIDTFSRAEAISLEQYAAISDTVSTRVRDGK